jgi:hypothetical protein
LNNEDKANLQFSSNQASPHSKNSLLVHCSETLNVKVNLRPNSYPSPSNQNEEGHPQMQTQPDSQDKIEEFEEGEDSSN